MVAGEAVHQPVLDHPRSAVGALETVAAMTTEGQRSKAAAVEEQQGLFTPTEVGLDFGDERRSQPAAARRRVLGQVDGADVGQPRACEALGQADLAVASNLDHVPAFDRRCRRGEDHRNVLEAGAHHRSVAGVILDPVLLLEARLVRLVDDDQAEPGVGEEQRRTGAHGDRGLPARDPAPGAAPLRRAQVRMPGDGRASKARLEALEEGLGQRNFRQEDQRLPLLSEAFGDRFEIDLGLARAGDSVEQHRVEAFPYG